MICMMAYFDISLCNSIFLFFLCHSDRSDPDPEYSGEEGTEWRNPLTVIYCNNNTINVKECLRDSSVLFRSPEYSGSLHSSRNDKIFVNELSSIYRNDKNFKWFKLNL